MKVFPCKRGRRPRDAFLTLAPLPGTTGPAVIQWMRRRDVANYFTALAASRSAGLSADASTITSNVSEVLQGAPEHSAEAQAAAITPTPARIVPPVIPQAKRAADTEANAKGELKRAKVRKTAAMGDQEEVERLGLEEQHRKLEGVDGLL
ncbi:hypothetical protein Vretimale_18414 [Volvox reticuliferus]|uniref:Uncharacterized protein n=1 Tax=Volvox reticuliferus TaxID=1737510 RepID=A0A8J4D2B9_9CHLO|nr:hypothetical protein Vretifemale_19143 [Volvox reticuliferus]GIM15666.1 hypothetical protein Vretimale_18414 [Volvox reticuliferus]